MVIIQKKSSGTWWKCLLSFFAGLLFVPVAITATLAFASTQVTAGELLGNYADTVLTVKYQEMTAAEILMSFINKDVDYMTLGGLSQVSPLIDKYLVQFSDSLNDQTGIELNLDELKTKTWTEIPDYLIESAKKGVKLNKVFGVDESSDNIMKTLCFEKNDDGTYNYDHAYTLNDILEDEHFIQNKVDTLTIKDVIGESGDGASKALKSIENKTIKELKEDDVFGELLVSDVIDITDSSPKILKTFRDNETKIKDMSDAINNLYFSDVYESSNPDGLPPVMKKLLGNSAAPVQVSGSPYMAEIDYETYSEVIFANGNDAAAEGYSATNYVTIKDFYDADHIEISKPDEEYVIVKHGTHDRSGDATRIFTIETILPSGWTDLYVTCCNKPTKVKDLDKSVDELTLKDVINLDSSSPLYKVRHSSVKNADQLFSDIKKNLTIKDIFGADLATYKFINKIDENTTIENIGPAINNMKLVDAFEENIYDNAGNLTSMWKYLLIEGTETWIAGNPNKSTDPLLGYECENYTLSGDGVGSNPKGINQMMDNMKYWMENQKLQTLQDDNMISVTGNLLITPIPATVRHYDDPLYGGEGIIPPTATYYGDLSTKEFVELMTTVLPHIS